MFRQFSELNEIYKHVMKFRSIYKNKSKEISRIQFNGCIEKTRNSVSNILNFFDYISTNANPESFNAKINILSQFKMCNIRKILIFRLKNLFA